MKYTKKHEVGKTQRNTIRLTLIKKQQEKKKKKKGDVKW